MKTELWRKVLKKRKKRERNITFLDMSEHLGKTNDTSVTEFR